MIRMVFKSEVNSANKLEAINTSALPVVTYSFNTINWTLQELAKLDRKTTPNLTWTVSTCPELKEVEGHTTAAFLQVNHYRS